MTVTDYDTPRAATIELEPEPVDVPQRRWTELADDLGDIDIADSYELPGYDILDEELAVAVVEVQPDEFRCHSCFLVLHKRLNAGSRNGRQVCRDCA